MVRKLAELPKFLVFNSGTNSFGNNSVFAFYLLLFTLYRFLYLFFKLFIMGFVTFLMSVFQMELNDYSHFDLTDDKTLCSMGQHCPRFLRVVYNAIIHLGYDRDAPVYRCRLSMAHGMAQCEVSVMIPFDPTELWLGSIIGSEPDNGV
jgi:hypothetical protein